MLAAEAAAEAAVAEAVGVEDVALAVADPPAPDMIPLVMVTIPLVAVAIPLVAVAIPLVVVAITDPLIPLVTDTDTVTDDPASLNASTHAGTV